ncbi:MAG: transcription termination/antitermination factor NusG [Lachnospiraceae bacterium]|nr:transcription termination/antitermination factor NusG [Lachnospiraceae bacterium]
MAEERSGKREWYVAHTYSGYENKVKLDIEQSIKNRGMEELIFEVRIPTQPVVELKKGKEKKYDKKLFPGYVLINMIMTDDTWYVVRNTRGVTGFVGPDSKPVPIPKDEVEKLQGKATEEIKIEVNVGDTVVITSGAFKDSVAKVLATNIQKKTVTVGVDFMGGERKLELSYYDIKIYK